MVEDIVDMRLRWNARCLGILFQETSRKSSALTLRSREKLFFTGVEVTELLYTSV